jgi:hypothetical protein
MIMKNECVSEPRPAIVAYAHAYSDSYSQMGIFTREFKKHVH